MSSGKSSRRDCRFLGKVNAVGNGLPSVQDGKWIEMDYYIKMAGPCIDKKQLDCPRLLEVWAQGEKIVEVRGWFGAEKLMNHYLNSSLESIEISRLVPRESSLITLLFAETLTNNGLQAICNLN